MDVTKLNSLSSDAKDSIGSKTGVVGKMKCGVKPASINPSWNLTYKLVSSKRPKSLSGIMKVFLARMSSNDYLPSLKI